MKKELKEEIEQLSSLANQALEIYNEIFSQHQKDLPDHRMELLNIKSCIEAHMDSPLGRNLPLTPLKKGLKSHIKGTRKKDSATMWDSLTSMQRELRKSKHLTTDNALLKKPPDKGGLLLLENQILAIIGHGTLVREFLDAPGPGRNALGVCR